MVYEMGLDSIDKTPVEAGNDEEWLKREERRRVWWAVWELDGLA